MPTYRNDTERRITFEDKNYLQWQPGEEKALAFFVPHAELELSMVSEEPYVLRDDMRGIGYAEMVVGERELVRWDIPYCETYELSVFARGGRVNMFFSDAKSAMIVDELNNHLGHYPWDYVAYLTFQSLGGNVAVYVKTEPMTFEGSKKTRIR